MKPWNPYAMTFHGQPIVGQTPPKLVVYGPPLTAQQGAMLQTAYNAFIGAARVSIVPNPTRQGRLLDGSPYTIECSGASCTCTVWTAERAAPQEEVFSGILFLTAKLVIVNQGKVNEPGVKWTVKDVSDFLFSPEYKALQVGDLSAAVPYIAGVTANTSVILPGKEKYLYDSQWIGRYGNIFGVAPFAVVGITADKDAMLLLENGASRARVLRTVPIDVSKLFPAFGAAPATPETIDVADEVMALSGNSGSDPRVEYVPYSCKPSKNGKSLVYIERHYSDKTSPSDIVGGKVHVKRQNQCGAKYYAHSGAIVSTTGTVSYLRYKQLETKILKSDRLGDGYTAGEVFSVVGQDEISSTDHDYAVYSVPEDALRINHAQSSVSVLTKAAPRFVNSGSVENRSNGYWIVRGNSIAQGPIQGAISRSEVVHDVSPHYVGNTLVMLDSVYEFSYLETCTGSIDYRFMDGYFDDGYYPDTPAPSDDWALVTSPKDSLSVTNEQINVSLSKKRHVLLNNGERFYTNWHVYSESSTYYELLRQLRPTSGAAFDHQTVERSLSYTVDRASRTILVYDPELDLLCFQECVYATTKAFSDSRDGDPSSDVAYAYSNSGGGGLPVPPDVKIIIRCKGKDVSISRPFDVRDKRLASLLPATGISPYAVKDSQDLLTGRGFAHWPISMHWLGATEFNLTEGGGPTGDASFVYFRGLAPHIDVSLPTVEYVKTPETGGAYLRVFVEEASVRIVDAAFLVDGVGVREIEAVLPGFDIGNEQGRPF